MARDFGYVCESEFPARQVAEYMCRHQTDPSEIYRRKQLIFEANLICKELMDLLNQDRSPLCNTNPQPILEPGIQRHLTHFSHITQSQPGPIVTVGHDCRAGARHLASHGRPRQRAPHATGTRTESGWPHTD